MDVFNTLAGTLSGIYRGEENFRNQWGLSAINADWAYAHVNLLKGVDAKPGLGVTIGFIDTGIDETHPLFAGKTVTEEFLNGAADETGNEFSHGTAVASVAAAVQSALDKAPQGVAWGADVAMFAIPVGAGRDDYVPIPLAGIRDNDANWAGLINHVLNWRDGNRSVDFLNLSLGFHGIIDSYGESDLRNSFSQAIDAMEQEEASDKTILIWAAGNAHGVPCDVTDDPAHCVNGNINAVSTEVLPGLAARLPELRGHSLAVVAVDPSGQIAGFSNRCGLAAEYCLAAPGEDVRLAYFGPASPRAPNPGEPGVQGVAEADGTSFAAPMVAGGLAIMKQLFRAQLSNTELVTRLLETADDDGEYADQKVYGHGLMDLKAATSPVGVLDVPVTDQPGSLNAALQETRIRFGPAFGDGPNRSFAGQEIAAFDALGAPFWFGLGDLAMTSPGPSMRAELGEFTAPRSALLKNTPALDLGFMPGRSRAGHPAASTRWRLGLDAPAGAEGGHLALARYALTMTLTDRRALSGTAFTTEGVFEQVSTSGALLAWRPIGSPVGLHVGWIAERETMLGSRAEGAFGTLAADAAFVGVKAALDLGGWRLGAAAEIGTVDPAIRNGLITDISPLTTSAFTLHASRSFADDGTLRLSVSQPLRVEQGQASLGVPVGRTRAGEIVLGAVSADLAPRGRQIDVMAQWHQPLAIGELRLGAVATHQSGHRMAASPELTLLSGWRWTF